MRSFFLTICCFVFFNAIIFPQPSRKGIIDKRIKALSSIDFDAQGVEIRKVVRHYSILGDDSSMTIDGKVVFVFNPTFVNNRIVKIERLNSNEIVDQIRLFTYNNDSTYSEEIKELREDYLTDTLIWSVRSVSKYTLQNVCIETILRGRDTMVFDYISSDSISKAYILREGKRVEMYSIEYNDADKSAKILFSDFFGGHAIVNKSNEWELVVETKQYLGRDLAELEKTTVYTYLFYDH